MIHRVEIENYGSIRERQVIDLRIPATAPDLERFARPMGDESVRLPTVVAFFGPNASGKSTVLRAMANVLEFAASSVYQQPPPILFFQPFRMTSWRSRPTAVLADFDGSWIGEGMHVYRYQLRIGHGSTPAGSRVEHESLWIKDGLRFRFLFKRDEQTIRCAKELQLTPSDERLKAVRQDASVISTMALLNHNFFRAIQDRFANTLRYIAGYHAAPDPSAVLSFFKSNKDALEDLILKLSRLDIGLKSVELEDTPRGLVAAFTHDGLDGTVGLSEESNGTQSFMMKFPSFWLSLAKGLPALIDEFDIDLHPMLLSEMLTWFQDPAINRHQAQLFFAAHNVSIMEALEKEEIYLIEKSRDGASSIIGLKDVRGVRREPSLQRKYLGGVFGAVPNIG
ncbi:MAG: AAA family ATPase [Rhodospirillales bacterium]|nr:AAA family ATPase [Rhodospirillales bacterium]